MVCETLIKRGWGYHPAEPWMCNVSGEETYRPAGGARVRYTKNEEFSQVVGTVQGSEWLYDKSRLAQVVRGLGVAPPTWRVDDGL